MLPFVLGFLMGILMVGLGVITHKGVVAIRQHREDLFNHKVELEIARRNASTGFGLWSDPAPAPATNRK